MALTPILKRSTTTTTTSSNKKKVNFSQERCTKDFILKFRSSENESDLTEMITEVVKYPTPQDMIRWLDDLTLYVSLLDKRVEKLVIEFIKAPWYEQGDDISLKYHNFLISLVCAHNYYNYICLKSLMYLLVPDVKNADKAKLSITPGVINDFEKEKYKKIIRAIVDIYKEVPLCHDIIMKFARKARPYVRNHIHCHVVYTCNMLILAELVPEFRVLILEIIVTNMITLDVRSPRSEIQELDDDDTDNEEDLFQIEMEEDSATNNNNTCMKHGTGNTLDRLMMVMFQYIHNITHGISVLEWAYNTSFKGPCSYSKLNNRSTDTFTCGCECNASFHNIDMLKKLYNDMKSVFTRFIMCTYNSSHVQFLIFYMMAIRPGLVTVFLEHLFEHNFKSIHCLKDVRHNAIAYFGSLLARAKFVPFIQVHSSLEMLCNWCHLYLENQERLESNCYEDLMLHSAFYHACQTIFYVFTFRYAEYTENPKRLNLARSLGMDRLVSCKLNPLKVCSQAVVSNFAAVTRRYQLVYCYTIIMNNKRSTIPTTTIDKSTKASEQSTLIQFFPFDPYLLKSSKGFIQKYYREFGGLPDDCDAEDTDVMDTDDEDNFTSTSIPKSMEFSYGSCDGYKR